MKWFKKLLCKITGHVPDKNKPLKNYPSSTGIHTICERCGKQVFMPIFRTRPRK